ncbi:MAG: RNA methyltransferase [Rhodobacteraceae bacterium]|nr:RNA methyltransferase [Paracoccaceae bacterium]
MKKPKWVVAKEQVKKAAAQETVWLFGLHAVRDALLNPNRQHLRLILTKNAADKLADAVQQAGIAPEICDPRKFSAPLDPTSVHQGAALETKPLQWGNLEDVALAPGAGAPRLILLDQVTDPHNVGAILPIQELQKLGYLVLGLDGEATKTIDTVYAAHQDRAIALVLGAEGPGLRQRTKETVDQLVRIEFAGEFGSLNVSNAAAVALYAVTR